MRLNITLENQLDEISFKAESNDGSVQNVTIRYAQYQDGLEVITSSADGRQIDSVEIGLAIMDEK